MSATGGSCLSPQLGFREAGRFHIASQSLSLFGVIEKCKHAVLGELDSGASKVSLSFYRTIKIEFCKEKTFCFEVLQRDKAGVGYWRLS